VDFDVFHSNNICGYNYGYNLFKEINMLSEINIRQLIAEQTCFDKKFKGKRSKGIFIDSETEKISVVTQDGKFIPYDNKINKNPITFMRWSDR
jgi:hypothetical protein